MAKKTEKTDVTVEQAVAFCREHKLEAEIVGAWVWVTFAEKPGEAMRNLLRDFGFRWSARRRKWAHNCGTPSRAGKGNPWEKYSVQPVGQVA